MSTKNRRVAAYLPLHVDEAFKAFKSERNIDGDSEALIAILSEYLQVAQEIASPSSLNLFQRIEALEAEVSNLKSNLLSKPNVEPQEAKAESEESKLLSSLQGELLIISKSEPEKDDDELPSEPQVASLGPLSNGALAKRLGVTPGLVSQKKLKYQASPDDFVQWSKTKDPDGIGWEYHKDDKRYHPVQSGNPV